MCNLSTEKHMLRKILNIYLIFQKIGVFNYLGVIVFPVES